jgi:hypothetical protein
MNDTAKKPCPQRPECFMFLAYCKKCQDFDGCRAWK